MLENVKFYASFDWFQLQKLIWMKIEFKNYWISFNRYVYVECVNQPHDVNIHLLHDEFDEYSWWSGYNRFCLRLLNERFCSCLFACLLWAHFSKLFCDCCFLLFADLLCLWLLPDEYVEYPVFVYFNFSAHVALIMVGIPSLEIAIRLFKITFDDIYRIPFNS